MKKNTCDDCMLDKTDACSGRTDGHICSDFLRECSKCPEYDTINHNCPLYCKFIRETLQECLVVELEKVKAEIQSRICQSYTGKNENNMIMNYAFEDAIKIIDSHIKELNNE